MATSLSNKIYHSRDLKRVRVDSVDLRQKPMGNPQPNRPRGGIVGLTTTGIKERPITDIERKENQAQQKLDEANRALEEAHQRVEDAKHQAEIIQRDAYHAGFEHGEKAGEKLGEQKIDSSIQSLTNLIEAIQTDRERIARLHEKELIKVAFAIATETLKTKIEMEPEVLAGVVNAALARVTKVHSIKLIVSTNDRQLIERMLKQRPDNRIESDNFTLIADERLARGTCRVETETGSIDCSVEESIQTLHKILWNA